MELKLFDPRRILDLARFLLIVPYGIETCPTATMLVPSEPLLIVPYGIETSYRRHSTLIFRLLIVPYGIET